ncbi:hypothetical protein EW145_g7356, partial [Phellinidium pouzarii]
MANINTIQLHTFIMCTHEAISKDDGIKDLIVEAIEKEHPGEGNVYMDKLGKKVMDGPFGYIAQSSHGVGDERVLKSVEEKFSLLEKNVDWGDSDSEDEGDKGPCDGRGQEDVAMGDDELEQLLLEAADAGALDMT